MVYLEVNMGVHMVIISVLLALIAIILGLLIFSKITIKNQQRKQEKRKITIYHGVPVVDFCYPKPDESGRIVKDESGHIISIDGIPFDEYMGRL